MVGIIGFKEHKSGRISRRIVHWRPCGGIRSEAELYSVLPSGAELEVGSRCNTGQPKGLEKPLLTIFNIKVPMYSTYKELESTSLEVASMLGTLFVSFSCACLPIMALIPRIRHSQTKSNQRGSYGNGIGIGALSAVRVEVYAAAQMYIT
uniref:Uncharacterized protein n=1 Tax=Coccidioides posadasii RMSCC 3488 TaxID=454284 RepID=A0A0J6IJR0_COCPO|nr:hypothetical protein CPAG_08436 [Coccidioides posadasii RMSCC 3488]